MGYEVKFDDEFDAEFSALSSVVQDELLAELNVLARIGPTLGRPKVDTLKGSIFPNMKELRFGADGGVWRVAFAFDPHRRAIILVAGDKKGADERRFYKRLISQADMRFSKYSN